MLTKQDFLRLAFANIDNYETLSGLFQIQDPRLLQNIEAIATMLAMYSAQLEVSQAEPFSKTRPSTVYADAAMRGIIPKTKPTEIEIEIINTSNKVATVAENRTLIDSRGRYLQINNSVTIPVGTSQKTTATQIYSVQNIHTISESFPFYAIEIKLNNEESTLCGIRVMDDRNNEYKYIERYVNTLAGEKTYHIEVDERRRFYIRFGYKDVVGVQPEKDDVFKITAYYSTGKIEDYSIGDKLSLETNNNPSDAYLNIQISAVKTMGSDPIEMDVLREISKYPSVYNHNAVYLGEFDFIVRRNIDNFNFLCVWNEAIEEKARGANLDNINCLFVALFGDDSDEILKQYDSEINILDEVKEIDYSGLQKQAIDIINHADNTYKVRIVKPVTHAIHISITAKIMSSLDTSVIEKSIVSIILKKYGRGSVAMSKGRAEIIDTELAELLKDQIPSLAILGTDIKIQIENMDEIYIRPEVWNFVTDDSLEVSVISKNMATRSWGVGY